MISQSQEHSYFDAWISEQRLVHTLGFGKVTRHADDECRAVYSTSLQSTVRDLGRVSLEAVAKDLAGARRQVGPFTATLVELTFLWHTM